MSTYAHTPMLAFAAPQIIVYPDRVTATVRSADSSTIEQLTRLLATCDTPLTSSDSPLSATVGQLLSVTGHDVFCCTHGSRDARCGAAGPLAVQHMQHAAQEAGFSVTDYDLQNCSRAQSDSPQPLRVWGCAHVGGHRCVFSVLFKCLCIMSTYQLNAQLCIALRESECKRAKAFL
jgi:Sucrase/ferredoxin-like